MAVKIRLARAGTKKKPFYRIVAADQRCARDGRFLERVGSYDPMLAKDDEKRVILNEDRIRHWLGHGAQVTDRVARFLDKAGIMPGETANRHRGTGKRAAAIAAKKAEAEAEAAG